MDRRKSLEVLFAQAADCGWSSHSGSQLQVWLEDFSANVMSRTQELKLKMQQLSDRTSSVEQELHNTFNNFRLLSNTQFIENRVCEEDETLNSVETEPAEALERTESYEHDILPRYKQALVLALDAHENVSRSCKGPKRLPFIIGTDEFNRDSSCGLSNIEPDRAVTQGYDSEAEKEGVNMAAQMLASGSIPDGDWLETDHYNQNDYPEPSVSAALDFKAMLLAALRGQPYKNSSVDNALLATTEEFRTEDLRARLPGDSSQRQEVSDMMQGNATAVDSIRPTVVSNASFPEPIASKLSGGPLEHPAVDCGSNEASLDDILVKIARDLSHEHAPSASSDASSSWPDNEPRQPDEFKEPAEFKEAARSSSSHDRMYEDTADIRTPFRSNAKPASHEKLSSLLFGDEDDEGGANGLFGPVREHHF